MESEEFALGLLWASATGVIWALYGVSTVGVVTLAASFALAAMAFAGTYSNVEWEKTHAKRALPVWLGRIIAAVVSLMLVVGVLLAEYFYTYHDPGYAGVWMTVPVIAALFWGVQHAGNERKREKRPEPTLGGVFACGAGLRPERAMAWVAYIGLDFHFRMPMFVIAGIAFLLMAFAQDHEVQLVGFGYLAIWVLSSVVWLVCLWVTTGLNYGKRIEC